MLTGKLVFLSSSFYRPLEMQIFCCFVIKNAKNAVLFVLNWTEDCMAMSGE